MHKGHFSLFGACLLCVAWGLWETLQGHFHHAWPAFAAAAPGAQAARTAFLARKVEVED